MKKVLSLVLVLTLVLGSFGFAFADTTTTATTTATPKDVVGTEFEGAVAALSALGVVSGYEDGTYKPANIVTRAEMAKLIIAELGLEANATGSKSTFKDMSGYGWAEGYIGYAQSLGIVSGYGDGTFKPGKTVSYDEALTMIVSALGYTKECKEMNGSWPAIYVQKARVLGLTDDVKAGGAAGANRGDIAIYLYNMLTADMGYADADGVYQPKKDKDGDPIKVITNLDAEESTDGYDGYTIITKDDADDALVNIKAYVGACAKTFKMTKGKNDGKIIAISDVKSEFITGEYKAGSDKKLVATDGTEYKLDDVMKDVAGSSSEKYITTAKNYKAMEFVNGDQADNGSTILDKDGVAFDTTDAKNHTFVTIAADLSGKTVKGVYSVMMWGKGTNATVVSERVDADDLKAITSTQKLLGKEFTLDDDDKIDTNSFELIGVNSLSDIKADNIVYVYTGGKDKEITRVAVGTEVVKGEITKMKESDDDATLTVDGKNYKLADQKLSGNGIDAEANLSDFDTEDEVELYLDAYGYVYDYEAISGKADNYAVVLEVGGGNGSIGSNKHEIKLFLADGTDKVFNVDDDVFKSGKTVKGVTKYTTEGEWDVTSGAIVKYGVDKDGVIDSFEKIHEDKDYTVRAVTNAPITTLKEPGQETISKESDITKSGYFNGYEIKQNAVIFSFNGKANGATPNVDIADEDDYGVTTLEKVLDKSDVRASYVVYKNKIVSMLLYDFSDSDNVYGVVVSTRKTSGDADYQITMLVNGEEKTYGAKEAAYSTARRNDNDTADKNAGEKLFRLDFNAANEIKELVPAYTEVDPKNGDTYGYAKVAVDGSCEYKNNIFKTGTATISGDNPKITNKEIRIYDKAKVYYNDGSDFVVGGLDDLKGLKAGSYVWAFDTEDDNNELMDIVVVYKADADTDGKTDDKQITGLITYINTESGSESFSVDGKTPYFLNAKSILTDKDDKVIQMGAQKIITALKEDDQVEVTVSNDVMTIKRLATADELAAAAEQKVVNAELAKVASAYEVPYGTTAGANTETAVATLVNAQVDGAKVTVSVARVGTTDNYKVTLTGKTVTSVTAEKDVAVTIAAASSAKAITATTIGGLSNGNIINVPAGTKVDTFKAALTVSPNATVEILAATGGSAVTDQDTTDVTATMVIQVTAQDGTKAEYTISM